MASKLTSEQVVLRAFLLTMGSVLAFGAAVFIFIL
jgi:hypothetical protein